MPDNERKVKSKPEKSKDKKGAKKEKTSSDFPSNRENDWGGSNFAMIRPLIIGDRYRDNGLTY